MKKKKKLKPQTTRAKKLTKKKLPKILKNLKTNPLNNKTTPPTNDGDDFLTQIKGNTLGLKLLDGNDFKYPVHPEAHALKETEWVGMLTLKIEATSYSANDQLAHSNRKQFLHDLMENIRSRTLRIKKPEFQWVACEEFGASGIGHWHILISFDQLRQKNRMDKVQHLDFSENCSFYHKAEESFHYICKKLGILPKSAHFHWSPACENDDLVGYFCKIECGKTEKHFDLDQFIKIDKAQEVA